MDGYKTVKQTAEMANLSVETVLYRLRKGHMKGERVNREWLIPDAEVWRAKIEGHMKPGPKAPEGSKPRGPRKPKEAEP